MRIVEHNNYTYISLKDKYGKIPNEQILIYARSGFGKGLCSEGLAEKYHENGYLVINVSDPKHELEYAYQMFEPQEKYHLEHLRKTGKKPGKQKVKIYHPFTFGLPTERLIPQMNIFTIPIKTLGRTEFGLISEVSGENEAVSSLLKGAGEITNEDGLYSFLHYIQDRIKGKEVGKKKKPDWKNFGLEATSGTMKEMRVISNYVRPFKKHYFLSKQNCEYNLDWKKILSDQEHYHTFVSNYIGREDEKVCDFLTLYILESILRNKQYIKCPILILFPEISKQCPYKSEKAGHKYYLAVSIQKNLKTMRSEARGITSIGDSQVWGNVEEDLRGSATINFYGELGDVKDVENLCKAVGWDKSIKEQLSNAEIPRSFLVRGVETEGSGSSMKQGGFVPFYPKAMHCEPEYNFEEMYRKHNKINPEEYPLMSCKQIVEKMKKDFKDEEKKIRDKIKRKEKEEKLEEERKEKEKQKKEEEKESSEVKKEKSQKSSNEETNRLRKLCYEFFQESGNYREVARKMGFPESSGHKTAKKYIEEYEKQIKEVGISED